MLSRRGPVTWDAVVQQSDRLENDDPVVLLAHGGHHSVEEGTVLRILDARVVSNTPDESEKRPDAPIASLTFASEVYVFSLGWRALASGESFTRAGQVVASQCPPLSTSAIPRARTSDASIG